MAELLIPLTATGHSNLKDLNIFETFLPIFLKLAVLLEVTADRRTDMK